MKNNFFSTDERMSKISGQIAIIFLSLTQLAILGLILYKRYWLHLPENSYNDLRIILGFSLFGFIGTRLYFGGILPLISIKVISIIYLSFVTILSGILITIYGMPKLSEFHVTFLPVLLGPAIILGLYSLFAFLGKRQLKKFME